MRPFASGGLSPVAARQLAAWEDIARSWALYNDSICFRCASCHIAVWRRVDEHGNEYQYTNEERSALIVAHLRQAHMDLDPDLPANRT